MKLSPNQLRVELKEIQIAHLQLNNFYWGDVQDATVDAVTYPLMNCYYPTGSFKNNSTPLQVSISVSDLIYKDGSNLNDVESDTLQIARDIYNIINKSTRWKRIGKVTASNYTKFKWGTNDVTAGHTLTITLELRDVSGICDLPMINYDFEGEIPSGECPDARVINSDLTFDQAVSSGSILELSDITYSVDNSESTVILSGTEAAQSNVSKVLPDILITNSDGVQSSYPSSKDYICTPIVIVPQRKTAKLMQTGQPVSYITGDAADVVFGRDVDWLTLDSAPLHDDGSATINTSTFRFTDEFGGQTFTSGIILDWSTWDGATVLGWQNNFGLNGSYNTLAAAITFCNAFTLAGFSGWHQCNLTDIMSVFKVQLDCFNYHPFNSTAINYLWTNSTTSSTKGFRVRQDTAAIESPTITANNGKPFPCRYFTLSLLNVLT